MPDLTEFGTEFFEKMLERDKDRPDLPLREESCHDCAVTGGFYTPISASLKQQSEDLKLKCSKKWFCHNEPSKACRGNANFVGVKWNIIELNQTEHCPNCGAEIRAKTFQEGGGVECSLECGWWECY